MNRDPHHADRRAATLATRAEAAGLGATTETAGALDQSDARVTLHQLWFAVDAALAKRGTDAARDLLRGLDTPDLRAGTVQDGTARGLEARLLEALDLCAELPADCASARAVPDESEVITGKDLRRRREILIASGGTRVRFSRKNGIHMIDRSRDLNEPHFVQFDDQADVGCLDAFEPAPDTRARIFSPAFLKPERLVLDKHVDVLTLAGRLGRGPRGFDCRLELRGDRSRQSVQLRLSIDNRLIDHRLRIRFVSLDDPAFVGHRGTPGFSTITSGGRRFVAATLVRACGRLRVGDAFVATPAAQMQGPIEHVFFLGGAE